MPTDRLQLAVLVSAVMLAGCATTAAPPQPQGSGANSRAAVTRAPLSYTPEVRKSSYADDRLFQDMIHALGGVDFVDRVMFPKATQRALIRIEVITPYHSGQAGVERWTIQHDADTTASYIVRFIPDPKGGTTFAVSKDKGSA